MEKNERRMRIKARQRITTRDRASKCVANRGACAFCHLQKTLNGMTAAIDLGHTVVEPFSPTQATTYSADLFCTRSFRDESTPQPPLKVERKIGSDLPGFL